MNFDGVQFERVRRITDPPIVALKARLDESFYGTMIAGNPQLVGKFPLGKVRYQDGWKHGVSHPFVAKRDSQRPLIVFDLRPGNPQLTGRAVWNASTSRYDLSPLALSPAQLHTFLSDIADQMLAIRWADHPEAARYPTIDDITDGAGQVASRKAMAQSRLADYVASGLEIDGAEAS